MPSASSTAAHKPWLARGLNTLGVRTTPRVDGLLSWVQSLLVAGVAAWVVLTYITIRMTVPTGSMEPTIVVGTSFFVDKLTYHVRAPDRGDIVVFWNEEEGQRQRLVKRLVAFGGETVQIRDCRRANREECGVYVDGQRLDGPAFDREYYAAGEMGEEAWTVPEGQFFVLGDHSAVSRDSRYWGFVDAADFIGEPFLRVWPLEAFGFMNGYFGAPR